LVCHDTNDEDLKQKNAAKKAALRGGYNSKVSKRDRISRIEHILAIKDKRWNVTNYRVSNCRNMKMNLPIRIKKTVAEHKIRYGKAYKKRASEFNLPATPENRSLFD
jgi:hypothetical protein